MNKSKLSFPAIVVCMLSYNASNAAYVAKVPLEIPQGGSLPYNSIIIGSGNKELDFDPPDPLPTDDGVVCEYNLTNSPNISVYTDGIMKSPDNEWISYKEIYYQGQKVINAFKGKEIFRQNDEMYNIGYYEVCIQGSPLYSNQNNEVENQEWDQDDCRYNNETGTQYSWTTTTTSDGRYAFLNASLGSFGYVTANSSNIIFPVGTITVPEGKILPEGKQRIIIGNTAFDRGNYYGSVNIGNNVFQSKYEVCKKTGK